MSKTVKGSVLLPWPSVWSARRPTASSVLAIGFLGFLALGVVGLGVSTLESGERVAPAAILGVGVLSVGALTALDLWILRLRRRRSPRTVSLQVAGSAGAGVAIFYLPWFYRILRVLLLVTACIVASFAGAGVLGWVAPSGTAPPDPGSFFAGGAALCLLLAWVAWLGWVVVEIAGRRLARGRLVLRPDGIYHRSFTFEHFVPWHAVVDVEAVEFRHGPVVVVRAFPTEDSRIRRTWIGKQQEFELLPFVVVRGRALAIDPAVVYHTLRYYHAHPEDRAELLTPAGEQRIRSGNVLD